MRELKSKLPSPSEHAAFVHCPTAWWLRYRSGLRRLVQIQSAASGEAASLALSEFYLPKMDMSPIAVYDITMQGKMEASGPVPTEEEWMSQILQDRPALEKFFTERVPLEDDWSKVLDCQERIEEEVNLVPDMVVLLKNGCVLPVEWKMVSPFADLEYESLIYEMAMQPISYIRMCKVKYQRPCIQCRMEFIVRKGLQKGVWKEIPPTWRKHDVYAKEWKEAMWESSANFANAGMMYVDHIASMENAGLEEIPKFTHNCIRKLGKMNIVCDFYPACSENMHPMQTGLFSQQEDKR